MSWSIKGQGQCPCQGKTCSGWRLSRRRRIRRTSNQHLAGSDWQLGVGRAVQVGDVPALDHGIFCRLVNAVGPTDGAKAAELALQTPLSPGFVV